MANEFKHLSVGGELTQGEYEGVGAHVFDSQATGDIAYASSATQLSRLGIGAENTTLQVSSGGIPEWVAAPTFSTGTVIGNLTLANGSITDSSGAISFGDENLTSTGVITGATVEATGDTSAGDNSALGYTSAEGAILTGQGSTSDVTIKNDADGTVISIPTGTTNVKLAESSDLMFGSNAILSDSSGTMTLSNVDALDATTEATIEGAIDTLANLTSASSLATVGTITSGTWQGTTIAVDQGGTGATTLNNLITLGTHTTGNYLATLANATNGGTTIANSGSESAAATVALNLNDLSAGAVADGDSIAFIDSDDSNATKKEAVHDLATLFAGTGLTATSSVIAVDASQAITALTGGDLTIYEDANNADVSLKLGTSATESLTIQVLNGASNKTAEEVRFSTATASGTADHGKMVFDVDGTDIVTIDDGGLNITSGSLETATIDYTDGDNAITIADGGGVTFAQSVTVTGDLTVSGTTTTVDTTNTVATDALIELNNGASSNSNDLGIVMERGSTGDNAIIAWDESADGFIVGTTTATGASTGNLTITAAPFTAAAITGTTIDATTDFTIGDTVITDGVITDTSGLSIAADAYVSNGNGLVVGHTGQVTTFNTPELQVLGTGSADSNAVLGRFSNDTSGASFQFVKSRNGTIGSSTIVQDNDTIGIFYGMVSDASDLATVATQINFEVDDASPGASAIGGAVTISTATTGGVVTESLRIDSSQDVRAKGGDLYLDYNASVTNDYMRSIYFTVDSSPTTTQAIRAKEHSTDSYGLEFHTRSSGGLQEALRIDGSQRIGLQGLSPSSYHSEADDLVIGGTSGRRGMTIVSGTSSGDKASVFFADSGGTAQGFIRYNNNDDSMAIATNGTNAIDIDSSQDTTFAGDVTVADAKYIKLGGSRMATAEPASNTTGYGVVIGFDSAGSVSAGDAVYINSSGKVAQANAQVGSVTDPVIGIATNAGGSDGDDVYVLTHGIWRMDAEAFTAGDPVYLGESAGALTATAPSTDGDYVQRIGIAVSDDCVLVMPSIDVIEHA